MQDVPLLQAVECISKKTRGRSIFQAHTSKKGVSMPTNLKNTQNLPRETIINHNTEWSDISYTSTEC